ncbi:PREDICTED: uncharacterized protein LOC104824673 [Tarenaya hassleriana]|uniref:uncharacterized protein LOC104824673 n=1 Tax=Tarenaya hassleriana TaxID=28532 RepID=UPI0008FCEBE6|nr:PREDICTED: uncharacterized protein LOC104824673 [Tarenaya hassleriana]XP_019058825.1 PREDICTED: uncharacterized protein LOC104824673 [Tarenaya hassleriana]
MSCLSHVRSYISVAIRKRSSQVTSWNQCCCRPWRSDFNPARVSMSCLGFRPHQSRVHCYSTRRKAGQSGKTDTVPVAADKEKDAFYVVRKGDIVGIYKNLSDCQAQVGSSVYDHPVSVYKGYSMPKDAEGRLSCFGLKNPLYTIRVSDLQDDMFGELTPCLFQEPTSSNVKISEESTSAAATKSQDLTENKEKDKLPSASVPVDPLEMPMKIEPATETQVAASEPTCLIEFDGASKGNPGLSGAAAVLRTEDGSLICKLRQGLGIATNNAAEYHGMILGLKYAVEKGYKNIRVKGDSKLVCMQMQGLWKVKHQTLSELFKEAKELSNKCISFEISHVLREYNSDADAQANLAARLGEGQVQED